MRGDYCHMLERAQTIPLAARSHPYGCEAEENGYCDGTAPFGRTLALLRAGLAGGRVIGARTVGGVAGSTAAGGAAHAASRRTLAGRAGLVLSGRALSR
jgi:hypothetical protein